MAKILCVDDDLDILELIEVSLEEHEVTKCADIATAVTAIGQHSFDLFILDVNLPDGTGFDLFKELKKSDLLKASPILFISGMGRKAKIQGLQIGADDYLDKPFDVEELRLRVSNKLPRTQSAPRAIAIDHTNSTAFFNKDDQKVELNLEPKEFSLLSLLVRDFDQQVHIETVKKEIPGAQLEEVDRISKDLASKISETRMTIRKDADGTFRLEKA